MINFVHSIFARNDALSLNPPYDVDEHITTRGSDWYWAVTAVMAFSAVTMTAMMLKTPRSDRIFHYITIAIVTTASVAYYTMGANLGYAPVQVEYVRGAPVVAGNTRQIFYARYIDWFVTTPLLLVDILLSAGLPWSTILFTVFFDWVMIVTGLLGALTVSRYKWGYYAAGCAAMFMIFWQILSVGRKNAALIGADVSRLYLMISGLTIVLWTLYPVAWGLSEGGNVIASDSEAIFYGVLDILAKVGFGFLLLFGHRNIDIRRLGLGTTTKHSTTTAPANNNITDGDDTVHQPTNTV